jgi:hypothetical protein
MVVLARVKRVQAANARARGELFAFEALAPGPAIDGATTPRGPLARRWARERLGDLLAGKHDRNAVTSHALGYGLVSPYTSLVAIGSDVIVQGGVKHSVAIPVSLPAGMRWQAVKQAIDLDLGTTGGPRPEAGPVSDRRPAPAAPKITPSPTVTASRPPAKASRPPAKAAPEPTNPKQRAATKTERKAADDADDDGGAGDASHDDERRAEPPREDAGADEPRDAARSVATGSFAEAESGEEISIMGEPRRALRLTAALGGGHAFDHGARGLVALDVRLETNRRTRVGVEAALWLVGGVDPEGRGLVTVARGGLLRWFELGFGAGIQLGNGTGFASALRLRANTPVAALAGYLRYDAAVLLTRPTLEAEQAVTLGLELSY